jgi:hypothetical protein
MQTNTDAAMLAVAAMLNLFLYLYLGQNITPRQNHLSPRGRTS